ncbi:MAG TPA: citrate/2-methylcitrate synthase [Candidatus Thermoplasmatota archaeon]|nr:citrate/2-methylcitrate synthase [Candidatus Thermoplasmatota archaeon]
MKLVPPDQGMLYYIIENKRPDLAKKIKQSGVIETIVVGLGGQGTRHAELMQQYGTTITAGIAPGRGGTRLLETIPVYDTISECLKEHPNIAVASVWRHYSTAKDATIEAIEAGIPLVILISEGIPLKDVRDILVAARKNKTVLIGGNTPGVIFPPEGIKAGMLPDVFYPEEVSPEEFGPKGVTIISRSGAILYHLSDALASVGIAQNAVLGVGGDGAIGSTFRDLVPLAMAYKNTDLVVVAGEIGGCQEELLADDIKKNPKKYPKPLVALISGAHAPEGKTMGHAGAIVSPGQVYGTFQSKKQALESVGIPVVNSQYDLITEVQKRLQKKIYFDVENYYKKMKTIWDAPSKKRGWGTLITKVMPNNLLISGYPLQDIVEQKGFLETAYLLVKGEFPDKKTYEEMRKIAVEAAKKPVPKVSRSKKEDISKTLVKYFVLDEELAQYPEEGTNGAVKKTIFGIGRTARYLSGILGTEEALEKLSGNEPFSHVVYCAVTGNTAVNEQHSRMIEAMIVACVDHGVTPPSAQATLIAASTRAPYEVAVAQGVGAITDVHGGAGAKAAQLFIECFMKSKKENIDVAQATREIMRKYIEEGKRIEGLGHRLHTKDPRRDVLWNLSSQTGIAGEHVQLSKKVSTIFEQVRGMSLPINVDGVIGAIVADMKLDPAMAKAFFIYGRIAGLSAHYFEEVASQPRMRQINFTEAVYIGKEPRTIP